MKITALNSLFSFQSEKKKMALTTISPCIRLPSSRYKKKKAIANQKKSRCRKCPEKKKERESKKKAQDVRKKKEKHKMNERSQTKGIW